MFTATAGIFFLLLFDLISYNLTNDSMLVTTSCAIKNIYSAMLFFPFILYCYSVVQSAYHIVPALHPIHTAVTMHHCLFFVLSQIHISYNTHIAEISIYCVISVIPCILIITTNYLLCNNHTCHGVHILYYCTFMICHLNNLLFLC